MTVHSSWPSAGFSQAVLFDQEPGQYYVGYFRNLSLVVWAGRADGSAVNRVRGISQHLVSKYPDGHSNISFVVNGVAPPTEEARVAFNHIFDGRVSDLRCMAVVLEGEGFWASALRSTVTALRQAATTTFAVRLFSTIDPVAEWLPAEHLARTGVAVTAAELRQVMHSMRYEIAATRSSPPGG
jgi:hypothetical protein